MKMRELAIFVAILFSTAFLFAPHARAAKLIFNTQDFAPFNYAIDGVVSGPAPEIIRAICKDLKWDCSFRLLPWIRAQEEVRQGKAHAMFVIGWNKPRSKWLYFTAPIMNTEYGFFVRKDNPLQFKKVSDVKGYKVGVFGPSNTSMSLGKIQAQIKDMTIDMRPDDEAGFKKLSFKRVDAVYSNRDVGYALIKKLNLKNIRYAGAQRKLKYHIGFSQKYNDKKIFEQFNSKYKELYKKGVIKKILSSHNMEISELGSN